jgi:hypothetical protein
MRRWLGACAIAVVLCPVGARADDVPTLGADACPKVPDHDRALKAERLATDMMRLADALPLQGKQTLNAVKSVPGNVRHAVAIVRCDEPALDAKELRAAQALEAKAGPWADAKDAAIVAEDAARTNVVLPLCQAIWGRDQARATIDHENANPSGVVNLKGLHDAGNDLQMLRAQIAALTPQYVAARHHDFTKWEDEGVCVAEASKPEGS